MLATRFAVGIFFIQMPQFLNAIVFNLLAVLDFLSEEAIDDASTVASYLSDSDLLLAAHHGMFATSYEAENVLQSAAASVAVRGVLFGNSHPLPSRSYMLELITFV